MDVDVFELHGDEEQIEPSEITRSRIAQDANDDIPRPQSKIMNLPNRNLRGIWDSQALRSCKHRSISRPGA